MSRSRAIVSIAVALAIAITLSTRSHAQSLTVPQNANRGDGSAIFLPLQSTNPEDVGTGKVLVASRDLADPNFAKTVILLVHCKTDGVVGLILNRRTDVPLSRILEEFEAAKGRSDPIYLGGPVETRAVLALRRSTVKLDGAEQILSGLYFVSSKALLEKSFADRPDPGKFHVYLGYAGWTNEQLRFEVKLGSWFIFPGDMRTIFDSDPDSLWRRMIEKTEFRFAESGGANTQFQSTVHDSGIDGRDWQ